MSKIIELEKQVADLQRELAKAQKKMGAGFRRGKSSGILKTPGDLRAAVVRLLGQRPSVDLACNKFNQFGELGLRVEEVDSLKEDWGKHIPLNGYGWLNPEYGHLTPWIKKCLQHAEADEPARIAALVPASVGSRWYAKYVHKKSMVLVLSGKRPAFDPENPKWGYPKDLILILFGWGYTGFDTWEWSK